MREIGQLTPEIEKTYRDRLTHEIDVIIKMGFPGYFLIVADFINWAKDQDIPVGPGRGSGAGSLAAYSLRITDIDPIPYGLLFERFLNIERMSMPDFDVDFCQERRDEVIEYVQQRYGGEAHVAQIVTFGSMKARAVIRDVGRALGMPYGDVDRIAKLIPEELNITLKKAIEAGAPAPGADETRPPGGGAPPHRPDPGGPHPPHLHPCRGRGHLAQAHGRIPAGLQGPQGRGPHPVRHEVHRDDRA